MMFSLSSLRQRLVRSSTAYPILALLVLTLACVGLDTIRTRNLLPPPFSGEKFPLLVLMLSYALAGGIAIYSTPRRYSLLYHLILIIGLAVRRYTLPADPHTADMIALTVAAVVIALGLLI